MNEIPSGVKLKLVKVGEAQSFQLIGGLKPVIPNGEFILTYDYDEKTRAGAIKETLILKPEQISTNSNTYQQVVQWIVESIKGFLDAIMFDSDEPDTTQWKLVINDDTIFEDEKQQNALAAEIPEIQFRKGGTITLYAKSDGVTNIKADGVIQGREFGE